MVGNRWESSNRPLFIRTVWKDGHHVVLRKDEQITSTVRSARRIPPSSRSNKKTTQPTENSSFKVPSVRMLLANLRNINNPKPKRCKTETRDFLKSAYTVDIIPSDSVRLNDLNKQIFFQNEKPKFIQKSNSVEVQNCYEDNISNFSTPRQFSYDNYCQDQFHSTLSERVLMWLDLAIQNHKEFKNLDFNKGIVTAQAYPIIERQQKPEENLNKNEKNEEEIPTTLITSQIEIQEVKVINIDTEKPKARASTAKRQLHIFLPNLPKKSSETSSFLSSKSSSLFQTNKL